MTADTPRTRALLLFILAASVRACFWLATPDREAANSIAYEGDAPKWLSFLLRPEGDIQLALPFHPPGMVWLCPWLTDGSSFWLMRLSMVLLGALLAPLCYLILRRGFEESVALLAGGLVAVATGLVMLSAGLHSETPYLVLFVIGLFSYDSMQKGRRPWAACAFGLTQAMACYLRVDHLAYVVLALVWLAVRYRPHGLRSSAIVLVTMALAFAPWQWHASDLVERANAEGFPGRPPLALPLPNALPWDDDAMAAVEAMPAFARTGTFAFVNDTVAHRGGRRVTIDDLGVLDEAYGSRPDAMSTPLLAMYGPMNFALANYEGSTGGFTRAAFDHRPPLAGGLDRYPRGFRAVLQPNGPLRWDYPPHLELINHGYRVGLERMLERPGWALSLMLDKLRISWRGAATGVGSYNVPLGPSGVRESVDITVAVGVWASTWRVALLLLAIVGLWFARRSAGLAPFVLFLGAKLITVVMFFGYARFGAMCVPTLALLWAMALHHLLIVRLPSGWRPRCAWGLFTLVLLLEGVRCLVAPVPRVEPYGVQLGPVLGRNEAVFVRY